MVESGAQVKAAAVLSIIVSISAISSAVIDIKGHRFKPDVRKEGFGKGGKNLIPGL